MLFSSCDLRSVTGSNDLGSGAILDLPVPALVGPGVGNVAAAALSLPSCTILGGVLRDRDFPSRIDSPLCARTCCLSLEGREVGEEVAGGGGSGSIVESSKQLSCRAITAAAGAQDLCDWRHGASTRLVFKEGIESRAGRKDWAEAGEEAFAVVGRVLSRHPDVTAIKGGQ